jgi:hypothetical protein
MSLIEASQAILPEVTSDLLIEIGLSLKLLKQFNQRTLPRVMCVRTGDISQLLMMPFIGIFIRHFPTIIHTSHFIYKKSRWVRHFATKP